jgi:hypothetical protein
MLIQNKNREKLFKQITANVRNPYISNNADYNQLIDIISELMDSKLELRDKLFEDLVIVSTENNEKLNKLCDVTDNIENKSIDIISLSKKMTKQLGEISNSWHNSYSSSNNVCNVLKMLIVIIHSALKIVWTVFLWYVHINRLFIVIAGFFSIVPIFGIFLKPIVQGSTIVILCWSNMTLLTVLSGGIVDGKIIVINGLNMGIYLGKTLYFIGTRNCVKITEDFYDIFEQTGIVKEYIYLRNTAIVNVHIALKTTTSEIANNLQDSLKTSAMNTITQTIESTTLASTTISESVAATAKALHQTYEKFVTS